MWSDGTPISIDDLLFTYDTIIKSNSWSISSLQSRNKIDIAKINDKKLRISFPSSSIDNGLFFLYEILPFHVLKSVGINEYISLFSSKPVTSSCGRLELQTKDRNSLLVDLKDCE
jgi:ABC-type transport system substrate-binding protein